MKLLVHPIRLVTVLSNTGDAHAFEQQCWTWLAFGRIAGLLGAGGR